MTQQDDRDPNSAGRHSGDDPETEDRVGSSDRGSVPVERRRTGEKQAAINREKDPPA